MTGVQANWHLSELGDASAELNALLSSAEVIDTSRSITELESELSGLITKEGRYWQNADLSCDLKIQPRHAIMGGSELSCFACPLYTEDKMEARSLICALGRQQETIVKQMQAIHTAVSLETELASAYRDDIGSAIELADALL